MNKFTLITISTLLTCTYQNLRRSETQPATAHLEEAIECVPFVKLEDQATAKQAEQPAEVTLNTEEMTTKDAAAIAQQCKNEQAREKLPKEQKEAAYKKLRTKGKEYAKKQETRKALNCFQLAGYTRGENYIKQHACCICQ